MATDRDIIQEFDQKYNEAWYAWNNFFPEADTDLRFYLGDQWDTQERNKLFNEGRNAFVFNKCRRIVNSVTGYQRKNRLSSVVLPVEDKDQKTADQITKVLFYVMNHCDGYQMISDCFGGALKTGWNLCSLYMDYIDDPVDGDIKLNREPFNSFIIDPYLTKLDFSDTNYILRRKYLSLDQTISLLPTHAKELRNLQKAGWDRDDKFTWLPYQRQPSLEHYMAYNEMYFQKWKNIPHLVDTETGEMIEFDRNDETIKMFVAQYPQLEVFNKPKRYIEKYIIVNDQFIKKEENPFSLDEYPFVPFICTFEPESDQWDLKVQSLIRPIRDPQREGNRRRSQMTDILDSQINSGWIANENSVINPQSLFQTSQGRVIWRREDAPPGSLEKIPPAQIPPSTFQLQELYDRDMTEIAGMNDAAFGQIETANDSGVLMMLRQGASITNLQDLFDNLRFSQKQLTKKMIKLFQGWGRAKVRRILNEDPTDEFFNPDLTKYDISIQEGVLTDTQKQMYFRQLVDLKQLGAPVTGEMLAEAAPIQGASKYKEQLAANEKAQAESAQKQQELQNQLINTQSQAVQAKAISDVALGKERFTRAVANMGLEDERSAKAVADRSQGALDKIKAIKELQSMDDDRLFRYIALIRSFEEASARKEEDIKEDNIKVSQTGEVPRNTNVPEIGNLLQELPQQNQGGLL